MELRLKCAVYSRDVKMLWMKFSLRWALGLSSFSLVFAKQSLNRKWVDNRDRVSGF